MFDTKDLIHTALTRLGKRKLVLSIHDASFPSDESEDTGRGTPYSIGGLRFIERMSRLGFSGLQLGPQGQTSRFSASPYDGTTLSRNALSIALLPLARDPAWSGLLAEELLAAAVDGRPGTSQGRVQYTYAFDIQMRLLRRVYDRFLALLERDPAAVAWASDLDAFCAEHAAWLDGDAIYDALGHEYSMDNWALWHDRPTLALDRVLMCPDASPSASPNASYDPSLPASCAARRAEIEARYSDHIRFYKLCQFIAHAQHGAFHQAAQALGLTLYADLQIGLSPRDVWARQPLFLKGYRLGAPPSRTNPAGQPWNFMLLDPATYRGPNGEPGPAIAFLQLRVGKLFTEYDGIRIDHPQGIVCPWVYRADTDDPLYAVQHGARLFCSPNLADHAELARYAIVRPEQLATSGVQRYDDGWIQELDDVQVERYAVLMDAIVQEARAHGRDTRDILCEVLSTQPYPLARVMQRFGLGRFRVTQKARLDNPADVYRSENAGEHDWVMVGNHDTAPIWRLADTWMQDGHARDRAAYLAQRLSAGQGSEALAAKLAADPRQLVHAQFADLFLSRAENVLVFFADLFGSREIYNAPGTVSEDNWSLRVPADYQTSYHERARDLEALNLPYALALALRGQGNDIAQANADLIRKLDEAAGVRS